MTELSNKRFIFTVTTGRSGSNFLTEIMGCLKGVLSVHEPKPRYDRVLSMVQNCPTIANEFLEQKKIPWIKHHIKNNQIFIESSHLFCKGFLEPWLSHDDLPVPDLIFLDRDLRKIALSMYQLNTIPGRNLAGVKYYLSPRDMSLMTQLESYEQLNDYQLCYWYCLEIERRKEIYGDLIKSKGGTCVHTNIDELKSKDKFAQLCEELNMPSFSILGKRRYEQIINRVVNPKTHNKKALDITRIQLNEWEEEVRNKTSLRGRYAKPLQTSLPQKHITRSA